MTKNEEGYNGWKNYETWVTKLWLDNDKYDYDHCQSLVSEAKHLKENDIPQVKEGIWTLGEGRKFILANHIKEKVEDMIHEEKVSEASLVTDLVNSAVSEIDFNEIAENMLSE